MSAIPRWPRMGPSPTAERGLRTSGALALGLALWCSACGPASTESGVIDTSAQVGAAGGAVEIVDPANPLSGLRIVIPAGALDADTEIVIRQWPDIDDAPPLQPGLVALGPGFELVADPAPSGDFGIVFPIRTSARSADQILSGFHFERGTWVTTFAARMDEGSFTISARQTGTWRFGVTMIAEVEEDTLEPAVVDVFGAAILAELEAGAAKAYDDFVDGLDPLSDWSKCGALKLLQSELEKNAAAAKVAFAAGLNPNCGPCDLSVEALDGNIARIVKQTAIDLFWTLATQIRDGLETDFRSSKKSYMLLAAKKSGAVSYFGNMAKGLIFGDAPTCNHQCLVLDRPKDFWLHVGNYYASHATLFVIPIAAGFYNCQLD